MSALKFLLQEKSEVRVQIPKFDYVEKIIEVPSVRFASNVSDNPTVHSKDGQWEALEQRAMHVEDFLSRGIRQVEEERVLQESVGGQGSWLPRDASAMWGDHLGPKVIPNPPKTLTNFLFS